MRGSKPAALRYAGTMVTFGVVPGEITLCVNIAGCPHRCGGCHSPELRRTDIGQELTARSLTRLTEHNKGITCVCLMGGDTNPLMVSLLGTVIKNKGLKSVLYSGNDELDKDTSQIAAEPDRQGILIREKPRIRTMRKGDEDEDDSEKWGKRN